MRLPCPFCRSRDASEFVTIARPVAAPRIPGHADAAENFSAYEAYLATTRRTERRI